MFSEVAVSCYFHILILEIVQEEQRVIEAKIRMRQQELQDEEERMQKRLELSSSSTNAAPREIEYGSAAGIPSLKLWFSSMFPIILYA